MIASGTLTTTISNGIATLTFGHPASNSFPKALLQQLTTAIQEVSTNDAVQVVVLQSEGTGVFCAGASFDELLAVSTEAEGAIFFSGFAHVINAMRACPKVIIGRIQGKAVGGGVGEDRSPTLSGASVFQRARRSIGLACPGAGLR